MLDSNSEETLGETKRPGVPESRSETETKMAANLLLDRKLVPITCEHTSRGLQAKCSQE